jgi:hypothetical protein
MRLLITRLHTCTVVVNTSALSRYDFAASKHNTKNSRNEELPESLLPLRFVWFYSARCFDIVISRKTVLSKKMFTPAIKHPMDTMSGRFPDLKSLAFRRKRTIPAMVTAHAIHFNVSAAFLSSFMLPIPCHRKMKS